MRWRQQSPAMAILAVASLSLSLSTPPLNAAVDCSEPKPGISTSQANSFNLNLSGFTSSEVMTALNYWSCPGFSGEIPSFQINGPSGIPVLVVKVTGNAPQSILSCGLFQPEAPNGYIESGTITVWTKDRNGNACPVLLTDVLAHEIGHLLGLADAPDLDCAGHIMGASFGGTNTRTVYADDCATADAQWETPAEGESSSDPWCDVYCWTSCTGSYCPPRSDGAEGCPLLVDVENDGVRLTGLNDPVWFDIDADGGVDLISWTDRGEGILVLDRNGNGSIEDGGELFGDATLLADGTRAANGYLALAELDSWQFGGNGDGGISADDAAFTSLRLWTDADHSGTSKPEELQTLEQTGIRRIELQYRTSHRKDRHGNELRYLGRAWQKGRGGVVRPILTWDVFFTVVPIDR